MHHKEDKQAVQLFS